MVIHLTNIEKRQRASIEIVRSAYGIIQHKDRDLAMHSEINAMEKAIKLYNETM